MTVDFVENEWLTSIIIVFYRLSVSCEVWAGQLVSYLSKRYQGSKHFMTAQYSMTALYPVPWEVIKEGPFLELGYFRL